GEGVACATPANPTTDAAATATNAPASPAVRAAVATMGLNMRLMGRGSETALSESLPNCCGILARRVADVLVSAARRGGPPRRAPPAAVRPPSALRYRSRNAGLARTTANRIAAQGHWRPQAAHSCHCHGAVAPGRATRQRWESASAA